VKILFILPEYLPHSGGGICTYYRHYINAIKPHCSKISVLVGSAYTQSELSFEDDGVEINYLDPGIYQRYVKQFSKYDLFPEYRNSLASAWAMWEQAKEGEGFDIIECTDFGLGFVPWVINHHKPLITRLHGSAGQIALHENRIDGVQDELFRSAELQLLPLCDTLITHSLTNQQFWLNQLGHQQVHNIYPAFNDVSQPVPLSERENYGLVTARIQRWKGPEELCEALALTSAGPAIKWIGRDMVFNNQKTTLQYLSEKFPSVVGQKVVFAGALPSADVSLLQQKAKFGLIPSTWDMFNFTCLEFMAAGTPVICSDGAGVSSLIEDGKNGFKYQSGDAAALARCIEKINTLPANRYMDIALAGIDTVTSKLSAQQIADNNLVIYSEVRDSFHPGSSSAFLDAAYRPSNHPYTVADSLNKQPLKYLTSYTLRRLADKYLKRK